MAINTAKIESLRKALGLTQEIAAKKSKLPGRAYWNDIVNGRKANVTVDVLERIAATLGVSAKDLLT